MFRAGEHVRVSGRPHDGHHRTPAYIKGKVGTVERIQGEFTNPETRAYGEDGLPKQPLYLVGFEEPHVWPGYDQRDRIFVDVYEHWLEAAG
jgi:Nitrile hydratase beta subunit, C-terminal